MLAGMLFLSAYHRQPAPSNFSLGGDVGLMNDRREIEDVYGGLVVVKRVDTSCPNCGTETSRPSARTVFEKRPPLISEVQRKKSEHSFLEEEEEKVSSLATDMLPRLLKIGVKLGAGQEKEQASLPASEVESSLPPPYNKKRRIRGKTKMLVHLEKCVAGPRQTWLSTPLSPWFLLSSLNDLRKAQKKPPSWRETGTLPEHLVWSALDHRCPESSSSILLPRFDEEEYFNQLVKGEDNALGGMEEVEAEKETKKEVDRAEGGSLDNPPHM
ncbi:hypothetical protein Acr_00g0075650 [Actinidia rufa]|uniref:Uncharacterized protein n=1 Tax=Actinidia rufa TaxID=165716 RepID=A0A7J0DUI5_9ERIC|nr:hypothetical protein Acr_00g0075650 [Actinidia rufa]